MAKTETGSKSQASETKTEQVERQAAGEGRPSAREALLTAQDQGFFGTDAAQAAGGIEQLRSQHQDRVTAAGTTLEGETQPEYPAGHPQDPTVRRSTTTS